MGEAAWYDVAFDALYPEIYAERDDAEAERVIAWLEAQLPAGGGALAGRAWVDLACGAGRHLRALARRGARAFGIDRSRAQIERAAASRRAGEELVLGDIRGLPFADRSFAGALSMFTSMGYFDDDRENRAVLAEAARVLEPGGSFLVDYFNAEWAARNFVPVSSRVAGAYRIEEERRLEPERGRFVKEVAVFRHPSGEPLKRYCESVALWNRAELEGRLQAAGFVVRQRAGDYEGRPFAGPDSPRVILLTERRG